MRNGARRTAKSIRINEDVYYLARVAAVTCRKSLGEWLEDAILEKMDREPSAAGEQRELKGSNIRQPAGLSRRS